MKRKGNLPWEAAKKVAKKVGEYLTVMFTGYEVGEIIKGDEQPNQIVPYQSIPQQAVPKLVDDDDDQFGLNEFLLILIVVLLVSILLITGGSKLYNFIGDRAVGKFRKQLNKCSCNFFEL